MNKRLVLLLIIVFPSILGCYPGISGLVIDAETEKPISGAVVLTQWTKSHGLGDVSHTVYKIVETETDRNGKFSLSGVYNPTVDPPILIICKKGYITWRNDIVFPSFEKRSNYHVWQMDYMYRLEKGKVGLSQNLNYNFLRHGIIGDSLESTPRFFYIKSEYLEAAQSEIGIKKGSSAN